MYATMRSYGLVRTRAYARGASFLRDGVRMRRYAEERNPTLAERHTWASLFLYGRTSTQAHALKARVHARAYAPTAVEARARARVRSRMYATLRSYDIVCTRAYGRVRTQAYVSTSACFAVPNQTLPRFNYL